MSVGGPAQTNPLRFDDLVVGSELARVTTVISTEDTRRLRELLELKASEAGAVPALVHMAFLRAVIAAGIVPDGAILTRLKSRHLAPLELDEELDIRILVSSKEIKRDRPRVTLSYQLPTSTGALAAVVDQTVIWPK